MRRVELRSRSAILLFACLRNLERSFDAVLASSWNGMLDYYRETEELAIMAEAATALHKRLAALESDQHRKPALLDRAIYFFNAAFGKMRGVVGLDFDEAQEIVSVLEDSLAAMKAESPPSNQWLIDRRMKLFDQQLMLEKKIKKPRMISKARNVQHFNCPDHIETIPLANFR